MDYSPLRTALADVVAIPVTPYDADGAVDRAAYRALLRRLLDGGVKAVTPKATRGSSTPSPSKSGGWSPS